MSKPFEIFAITVPGMEETLCDEAIEAGFKNAQAVPGGVTFMGHWTTVWKANLWLRGATRILARIGQFRVFHLAELDRKASEFDWADHFKPSTRVTVDVTCKSSKIYHQGAAAERISTALTKVLSPTQDGPVVALKVRIENNLCTLSIDTSGAPLHRRGFKSFVGKAPMRETLVALFLRQCGYTGDEPVLDPMCGSGTFLLEAADIATGRAPGRYRSFAFEQLAPFQPDRWAALKADLSDTQKQHTFYGSDRNEGAITGATQNAKRADLADRIHFTHQSLSDLTRPNGPNGLVILNPPYGDRIGDKKRLFGLYATLGKVLKERFAGWRVGLVTAERQLAQATELPFKPQSAPIPHGGIRITLYQTDPLP